MLDPEPVAARIRRFIVGDGSGVAFSLAHGLDNPAPSCRPIKLMPHSFESQRVECKRPPAMMSWYILRLHLQVASTSS